MNEDDVRILNEQPFPLRPCASKRIDETVCGGTPAVHNNDFRATWEVRCSRCPTFTWGTTPREAVQRWNEAFRASQSDGSKVINLKGQK